MEKNIHILWIDDEIDMLKSHILFLKEKGYEVSSATNGESALNLIMSQSIDLIFLDENMPGLSGLETLSRIKDIKPEIPVIMITKSEEEDLMNEAIGSKINDYLIKPVNPKQILLSIKKNTENKQLISKKTTADYQTEFSRIGMQISESDSFDDWVDIYKKIVHWELELSNTGRNEMDEVLKMQKEDANISFAKYIKNNYFKWFTPDVEYKPFLSPSLFKKRLFPLLEAGEKVFVIILDNLRYDQWRTLYALINQYLAMENEELYCSILPTTTQYARNSLFAGLMPYEIEKLNPNLWTHEEEGEGMNDSEKELLESQLNRYGMKTKFNYLKIYNKKGEKYVIKQYKNLLNNQLNVLVYNFIDILSHARTDVEMIKELAEDEPAYRSLTLSWFRYSYLFELIKKLSEEDDIKVIFTTDHGSIKVTHPVKITGDRETTTNLRYKASKSLRYDPKNIFEIKNVEKAHLPKRNMNYNYIFATNNDYFIYQNNYNKFVNYFRNTFQHGGISLEEMLIPYCIMNTNK